MAPESPQSSSLAWPVRAIGLLDGVDEAWRRALRVSVRALLLSRLVVWVAGAGALAVFGPAAQGARFDPARLTSGFGAFGDLLVGPAARWDSVWFLAIAKDGYIGDDRTAFFPLYPTLVRGLGGTLVAGVALSTAALFVALVLLHRLVELELGERVARASVTLLAFFPMAFFFSAVYSESLFLALSLGAFWCARRERWPAAGALGGLAAATRSSGLLLLLPLAILYLRRASVQRDEVVRGLRQRIDDLRRRVRPDVLWLALLPGGLAAYLGGLWLNGRPVFTPFHAQEFWQRHFHGPLAGIWQGTVAAWDGVRQLLSGSRTPVYFHHAAGDPFTVAGHNVVGFVFLIAALLATWVTLRRLPLAYGVYAVCMLLFAISYPIASEPLMSLPRFEIVVFPLAIGAAAWAIQRGALRPLLAASAFGLVAFSGQFAAWAWVA
ncbi:MAG TPA: mannosyltransferase family protein [Solirubrobacteraceae bacterium]|nr:mannosyltransferase family protein [Solirubrobacteraceae bacterium]